MAETNVHVFKHLFTHLVQELMYLVSGDCQDLTVLRVSYLKSVRIMCLETPSIESYEDY